MFREQPGAPCGKQTQVLVEIVIIEPADCRLEDVRGDRSPVWPAPPLAVEAQRNLGLRTRQTPPTRSVYTKPSGLVDSHVTKQLTNVGARQAA